MWQKAIDKCEKKRYNRDVKAILNSFFEGKDDYGNEKGTKNGYGNRR